MEDDPDDFDFITLRDYDRATQRKNSIDKRLMDSSFELKEAIDKFSKKPHETNLVQLQVRDDPDDATNLMSSEQETKLKSFDDFSSARTRFTQPRIG